MIDLKKLTERLKNLPIIFIPAIIVIFMILGVLAILNDSFILNPSQEPTQQKLEVTDLKFTDSNGIEKRSIQVEIADTTSKRAYGLMNRNFLAENRGMLFVFPDEELREFWMKDTYIPLDIIFLNAEKEIVKINKNAIPLNTENRYPSEKPAKYAIEVNGGWTSSNNINIGDKAEF